MINTQEELRKIVNSLLPKKKDVAEKLGIDPTYFSKWLNGSARLGSEKTDKVIDWIKSQKYDNS